MRRTRIGTARIGTALVGVALAAGLASCAQPGYSANKLERQLIDAGLSSEQATCMTNALEDTYDRGQLASRSEPTLRELRKTRTLLEACDVDPARLDPVDR